MYSNDIQDIYKNIEEYYLGKKLKILIVFANMVVDIINNQKLNPAVTELFIKHFNCLLVHNHILKCRKMLD